MSYTYSKIWLHAIITTSNRLPLITAENEDYIIGLLKDCFFNQKCEIMAINGVKDHIHILFVCTAEKAFADIIQLVCDESAFLINEKYFKAASFGWEKGYVLFSVSESQVSKLKEYILHQKDFHKDKSFVKELDDFLQLHGIRK